MTYPNSKDQRYTRLPFSEDDYGSGFLLSTGENSDSGKRLIHQTVENIDVAYEVWLYGMNTATTGKYLTVVWASVPGLSAAGSNMTFYLPPDAGHVLVIPGLLITGRVETGGQQIHAYAGTPSANGTENVIQLYGYVNQIENDQTGI